MILEGVKVPDDWRAIDRGPNSHFVQLLHRSGDFFRVDAFESALSEIVAGSPLYRFEAGCGSVLERFREGLEHVSLLILVDQNAEFLEVVYALGDSSNSLRQFCVV